jgi:hypothetical protein
MQHKDDVHFFAHRVEDDLNGAMSRKTDIFSRIYLLLLLGGRLSEWCDATYFRAFICFFCWVEDDLNLELLRKI